MITMSTRERILQTLLNQTRATINDLASAVGINAISVRHHLSTLQSEGLVTAEEQRHGVGRPRLVYLLTDKGVEHFPTRYFALTNRLIEQLKHSLPEPTVKMLFAQMASGLAATYAKRAETLPLQEKLEILKELLAKEGFQIEWADEGDHIQIKEINCPYYHVGQNHPEVCTMDQTLISSVLAIPLEKVKCVLSGDAHCTFNIPK
jgi:DeoR family transcriptional regulator, suf operon transcriptional repressor